MNKFELVRKIKKSPVVKKTEFILSRCAGKEVLDLGCVRHSWLFARIGLHNEIKRVAAKLIGVDILREDIDILNKQGYDIICADVCKPFSDIGKYDVIVAADLIEHLISFDWFFQNCKDRLKPGGALIITTPNPFYSGSYHFAALKQSFFMNPEHTCWIDPYALNQLSERMGFEIEDIRYLKDSWELKNFIGENETHEYDIIDNQWDNLDTAFRIKLKLLSRIFPALYTPYRWFCELGSHLVRHSDYAAVLKVR